MIELRPLAINDLNVRYARHMGGNKIRHYKVPMALSFVTGSTAKEDILKFIEENEGEKDVKFLEDVAQENESRLNKLTGFLKTVDVTELILKDEPRLRKSLSKVAIKSTIYQRDRYRTPFHRLWDLFAYSYNNKIYKINKILSRLFRQNITAYGYRCHRYQIPSITRLTYIRDIFPVRHLTIAFEEQDLERAAKILVEDLRILDKKGLIIGSLCMPQVLELADSIGSGKKSYAMYCFVIVDDYKLKGLDSSYKEMSTYPLSELGVKCEVSEGSIRYIDDKPLESKYEIEEVLIQGSVDANRKAHIENYEETKGMLNDIANKQRLDLRELEKVSSNTITAAGSTAAFGSQVHVNVTFRRKDGK